MSASFNQFTGIGNIVGDVQLSHTTTGVAVVNFRIAINEKYNDKESTVFIDCTAYKTLADIIVQYASKGSSVLVAGRLAQDEWTDKEGNKRSKYYIVVNTCQILSARKSQAEQTTSKFPGE
jgi:single-strand DNA-binding protein